MTGFAIGDAVSTIPAFSMNEYGIYGDAAIVPAHAVVKHPADLTWSEAAAIWMQYLTAYGALVEYGALAKGDAVIITAASSSVGLAAIQIVNSLGGMPIATTRTNAKRDVLLRAGAKHVIATEEQDLAAEVMRLTARARGLPSIRSAVRAWKRWPTRWPVVAPFFSTVPWPQRPPRFHYFQRWRKI